MLRLTNIDSYANYEKTNKLFKQNFKITHQIINNIFLLFAQN